MTDEILSFWFAGDQQERNKRWWSGSAAVDAEIRERFSAVVDRALAGELDDWAETARGRLALILVLDQLTRCLGRGTPDAFAGDPRAQRLALEGIDRGHDRELSPAERGFFYMPLMHAEDPELADRCVEQYAGLADEGHEHFLPHAKQHAEIVKRFGRYPHRNEILGREPTAEEVEFLESGGPSFGQKKT